MLSFVPAGRPVAPYLRLVESWLAVRAEHESLSACHSFGIHLPVDQDQYF
jgi:hypothetical protein